ncbi:protein TASOR 2 isoform X1 [Gopherus flavomarginatus]|uniref:protein TASOR 2 isoform X1 n=1 Tax=Gopherus flavomarginatus TaxID=286002 RepID=UPI0021CBB178|nr:protein TASOR 2 isoform X1 [Gopherus flavomarginatus]
MSGFPTPPSSLPSWTRAQGRGRTPLVVWTGRTGAGKAPEGSWGHPLPCHDAERQGGAATLRERGGGGETEPPAMGEPRLDGPAPAGTAFHQMPVDSNSLYQTAVSVLHNSYLDSTSRNGFQYSCVTLVENDAFLKEYKTFSQEKEASGYTKEELDETYAFLLFDSEREAKAVCQSGLRINTRSLTTLGDPAKGAYVSKYSDYLHPRPWYHGKSGCIVIFKLIKGKVKFVPENYTANYTNPTPGYDCHISVNINNISLETSHFRAFELSQYYVYEFSSDSVVERPRQLCPYVIIAFQYTEPKIMSTLNHKSIIELENKVYCCPWRGQLSIQGHILCDIALRSPYSAVIPAQLPDKLEIKYIIDVSDLKKKLPEAAFGKSNYTKNEVCYQDIYFSLYEVEISNKDQHKMDPLLENLKEKELAIIKYLQDQGFLILLTSSVLTGDKDFDLDKPISLQALFLFPSSRSVRLTVKKQELNCENELNEISLKVTSILPGLRYAIQEATKCPPEAGIHSSILVKRYFQKFAKLDKNSLAASGRNDNLPLSCALSLNKTESVSPSEKCQKESFSQLQSYISDPSSYSLEMSVALDCLVGNGQSLCGVSDRTCDADFSFVLSPDSVLPDIAAEIRLETEKPKNTPELNQFQEDTKIGMNPAGNLKMQQNKRKSSRAIVTSTKKKWAPFKILSVVDSNRKGTTKKKMNVSFPFPKKQGLTTNSNEPTLKLANLQFPHKRKRGAEVLSAEFVHRTQSEPTTKGTSSPEDISLDTKKPRKLKQPDEKDVQTSDKVAKQTKIRKETLSLSSNEIPSESQGTVSGANETYTQSVTAPDVNLTLKGSNYESPGLNLLADLALSSCIPPLDCKDSRVASPDDLSKERRSLRKRKPSRIASDHEYHRVDKHLKGGSSSSKTENLQKLPSPAKSDLRKDLAAIPRDKSPVISSKKNCTSPNSAKARPLLSKEVLDTSDVSKHSSIASEHSYASQVSEHSKKHTLPKGGQGPAAFRNGAKNANSGPIVGKVLPFRHQQNNTHTQKPFDDLVVKRRRSVLSSRLKEDFSKSHTVKSCDGSVTVTCQWEAEYLFNLDSKYTNNSLEKTVIRALHGPWDPDMPDDVEEMKLILHMWVALFYSKPNKFLSSTRKVVEHSNPEKYVSINSSLDAFELSDDCEGTLDLEKCPADSQSEANQASSTTLDPSELSDDCEGAFGLEKCPADSQSEVNQVSSSIHSTVSYSSEQLLSCDEPSSTSCTKTFSNDDCCDPSSPPLKDGPQEVIIDGCVDIIHVFNKVDEEKSGREELLDPVISFSSSTCSPSGKPSNTRIRPEEFSTDDSDEAHQAFDLSKVSQSDSAFSQTEFTENQENEQPAIISNDTVISEGKKTLDSITLSAEDKDNCQVGGDESLCLCEAIQLEMNMKSTEHNSPCGKGKESYDPLENQGEEEEEDFDYESINVEPIDLALSESNDADLEHEDMDQDPINLVLPKEICILDESKAISRVDLEEPFDSVLTLTLSPGASPVQDVPSDEITQSADALSENQEVTVKPAEDINDADMEHEDMDQDPINLVLPKEICIPDNIKAISPVDVEEPFDSVLTLTLSPSASPVQDVPSDEITQSADALSENQEVTVKPAEDINDADMEHEDMDQDPINLVLPKEICIPDKSKAISPVDLEEPFDSVLTLTLSPGASPVQDVPSDEITQSADALPENQEITVQPAEEIKPLAQSDSVEDSCISQEDRGSDSANYTPLSIKDSNQVQSNTATQGEQKKPSSDTAELLNKSSGASESPCLVFKNTHLEADSEAEKSCDKFKNTRVCSVTKKSPCNDELNQITMVVTHGENEASLCKSVESACILSVDNEKSFAKEHLDLKQIHVVNHQYMHSLILSEEETSPAAEPTRTDPGLMTGSPFQQHGSPISRETELPKSILEPSERDLVLCKDMTSDHTDQRDVTEMCSISESQTPLSAGDDSSCSCCTEQPKKDKFLEHGTPVGKRADLLGSKEEISPTDKPTCTNPELLTAVAFQPHSIPISRETDVHTSSLKQSEKNPVFSKSMNSDHIDQIAVMEIASSAVEDFSGSCYTERAKKDMFLEHEIPVGKVADLVENDDKEEPTSCEEFDLGSSSPAASTASVLEEEEEQFAEAYDQSSVCEITELQSDCMMEESNMVADLHQTDSDVTREEIPVSSVQMPTLCAHTDSRETLELSDTEDILEEHVANQVTKFPNKDRGVHLTFESLSYESFSGDSDQEYFGGTVPPTAKFRGSCSTRAIGAIPATAVTRTNYNDSCISSENENWKSDDWNSLEADKRFSVVESGWPIGFREDDRYVPPFVNIKDDQGTLRDYTNFIVTKKHKAKTRPLQSSKRHDNSVERSDLISSLTRTWKVIDDLTQNTLDMECLRFSYKLKQIIKSQKSRLSTSNNIFSKEFSAQVMAETLPLREAPEAPSLNAPSRSRSPLLITVLRSDARQRSSSWHLRNDTYTDFAEPPLFVPWQDKFSNERNAAKVKSQGRDYASPLHLGKLKYDDKLKESRGDISVILNEYAEFNRVMLNNVHAGNKGRSQSTTSEESAAERKKCTRFPKRTASYENMISDLCSTLHYRLKSVVKEACKNACMFYLVETEDDPFFVRMKSLLKKSGHTEIEPLDFCKTQQLETDRLIVIIRNEDISLHIHKIPSLLRLKHCPNVTFAGVDSPEDITDHTYQELFHMGGFVVSDDEVLETVTLGQLKEIVKTLEKLNSHGKWKWLLHYKESKKLKEDIRVDSTAHKKNWILKSCQEANTMEVLHYHQCDSKSCPKSEHLKCVLNLQVQQISARFAVYLTDKPGVSREVFESKGILVTDVSNFAGTVQNVVAPFQSSCWL